MIAVIVDTLTMALLMLFPIALVVAVHNTMAFLLSNYVMRSNFSRGVYYALGVVFIPIHELSHALMCLVFRHKITDIRLVSFKGGLGGYVNHTWNPRSPYQGLGLFFIAIAPLITAIVALLLGQSEGWVKLPEFNDLTAMGIINEIESLPVITTLLFSSLCFYCVPSMQDFKNSTKSVLINSIIIVLATYIVTYFNIIKQSDIDQFVTSTISWSIVVSLFSMLFWLTLALISSITKD